MFIVFTCNTHVETWDSERNFIVVEIQSGENGGIFPIHHVLN